MSLGYEAKIAPGLWEMVRPIGDATLHPENVRKHKVERIAQSLERFGQYAPIEVQASTGYIVKGNGTMTAALLLGWDRLAMHFLDIDDDTALAMLYADNKTSDQSTYDLKKLVSGLKKLQAGPGLFDSLWTEEEVADLEDDLGGGTVLEASDSKAEFATKDGEEIKHERAALPGEKMREVPMVLTIADHQAFTANVQILQKAFGLGGSIMTIVEAVKRQATWETSGQNIAGKVVSDDEAYAIKRDTVKELRDYFTLLGPDKTYTGTDIAARLEGLVPYRQSIAQATIAEGQVAMEPEVIVESAAVPDLYDPMPGIDNPEYEEAQTEALARFRESQS